MAISLATERDLPYEGEEAKLHTYMIVREDAVSLCGFSSIKEKNMFKNLITISGIGAKAAMMILSGMDMRELAMCIVSGNSGAISKIKGIGKKTAERIILELKEKIAVEDMSDKAIKKAKATQVVDEMSSLDQDCIDAINVLRSMGISKGEAYRAVVDVAQISHCIEDIITNALKNLG